MKIIQVMPEFGLAGAETMCENLSVELSKMGHTVVIASMYDYHSPITERLEANGITVLYLGKKPGLDLSMIGKLYKLFRTEKPDVVHTHRYVMQYAIPAAILSGVKKRVHTVHSIAAQECEDRARKLAKQFYRYCHVIPVALSERIRDTIVEEYALPADKIPVILNGVDLNKCVPKSDYQACDQFHILHIGRFNPVKNHKQLILAFHSFHEKFPASCLDLIGDGEELKEMQNLTAELDLQDSVRFLGLQSDVYGYLHKADAFVLPSLYEGIPMTLIEAMGTGLPIVTSPVGGIPDMLEDGKSALFADPDAEPILRGLEQMIESPKLREELGRNAKQRSTEFSAEQMAKSYVEIYKE